MLYRTRISNPLNWFINAKKWIQKESERSSPKVISLSLESTERKNKFSSSVSILKNRIKEWLTFPDKNNGWIPWAVFRGFNLVKKYNPQVIYTTSPPASTHLIGLYLKRLTGKPWIADFRDPWDTVQSTYNKSLNRMKLEEKLRDRVIQSADKIIVNTPEFLDYFQSYYHLTNGKVTVISNGYDCEDFIAKNGFLFSSETAFTISHIGELYQEGRRPDSILEALSELIQTGQIDKDQIRIRFIGDEEYAFSQDFQNLVVRLGLQQVVSVQGRISHEESIAKLFTSDTLLLLQTGERFYYQVPAKVFEYIAAGRSQYLK
jgi:glycosyltransferase involved in cell wall biosynthesis